MGNVQIDYNVWTEAGEWGLVKKTALKYLTAVGALARRDNDYFLTHRGLKTFTTKQILDCLTTGIIPKNNTKEAIENSKKDIKDTDVSTLFIGM